MDTIRGIDQLRERVSVLEQQKTQEWSGIKLHINDQYEKLRPANFIRNVFQDISESMDFKADILQAGIGLTSGMIVKAFLAKSKNKPLKKWLKIILIYVITAYVSKNRDAIIELGSKLIQSVTEMIRKAKEGGSAEEVDLNGEEEIKEHDREDQPNPLK